MEKESVTVNMPGLVQNGTISAVWPFSLMVEQKYFFILGIFTSEVNCLEFHSPCVIYIFIHISKSTTETWYTVNSVTHFNLYIYLQRLLLSLTFKKGRKYNTLWPKPFMENNLHSIYSLRQQLQIEFLWRSMYFSHLSVIV